MNQRMVSNSRAGNVTFWAWAVSIAVHLIVASVFGLIKFSHSQAPDGRHPIPAVKVNQVKKLIQADPTIPKPKIKKPVRRRFDGLMVERLNSPASHRFTFSPSKPGLQALSGSSRPLARPEASTSALSLAGDTVLPKATEFFGSRTDCRKLCYLVDCSGSMQGTFSRVRREMVESIQNLQPDRYFYIIFFGGDKLLEFGNGRLVRATNIAKSAASDFISSVRPAGRTNAMTALERAMQIRDNSGASPSVVYFLTDGFELTTEDTHRFSQKIVNLLKRFAPTTKINTIGFWPAGEDRKMLKTIAKQSGGEFVLVTDSSR